MDSRWGPAGDEAARWFARELRLACDISGMTHRELARRVGITPSRLSRLLTGRTTADLDLAQRLAHKVGHRLLMKVVPADGVRLRDAGQLAAAERIVREAHESWRTRLEVPIARAPDRRAADLVLDNPRAIVLIEVERWLRDLQAQLRAAQLKRLALGEAVGRGVDLVLAVLDTTSNRMAVAEHRGLIAETMRISSRRIWAAIRCGEAPGGDGLLWVRPVR